MSKVLYELTNPQKSIWLTEQYYKGTAINNIVAFLVFKDNPNIEAIKKAFNILLKNNDSYRTRISLINNHPMQYFADYSPINIDVLEIKNDEELSKFKYKYATQPLEIIDSQLFNIKILSLPDNSAILALSIHHIIADAWTISVSLEEELKYYNNILSSTESDDDRPSYTEFIDNQTQYFNSQKFIDDKEFWENYFNSAPETLSLKDGTSMDIEADRVVCTFSDELANKMNDFCKSNKISDYIFLLAVFSIYFRNMYNSKNFIVGSPTLNRANFREKQTTGDFISTMPVKISVDDSKNFLELCHDLTNDQRTLYRHLRYPIHDVIDFIKEKYSFSGQLFDIVFSYQNSPVPSYAQWIPNHRQAESLQIHIKSISTEKTPDLSIHYDYLKNVFSEDDILLVHKRIENIILQIINSPCSSITDLEIITNDELTKIYSFNNTSEKYNKNSNIAKEFENIVKKFPNKIAVEDRNLSLTYSQLNAKANFLANIINGFDNVSEIVSFALPRSCNIIIAILAILKSGHTYMPIDTEYPIDRINFMLQNSNSNMLITTKMFKNNINFSGNYIFIEDLLFNEHFDNLNLDIPSNKKAYIMYTSGSTGVPKAVAIKHYNVLNFVKSMQMRLNYKPTDDNIVLSVTTVCFDIFVFETFPTLLSGLTLVIASELESRSPELLNNLIISNKISKILTTPSRIDLLLSNEKYTKCLSYIKEFLLGGEPLPKQLVNSLKKHSSAHIYDLYGPTETTVYSSFNDVTFDEVISIGKPVNNTQIYILNENNKMLPINTIGEICIAGDGVGDGYYNNPEKTAEVFIKNPYGKGPLYKTGDLGLWTENGILMCYGRKDNQIKIRGYRIELDDIVNNILLFGGIDKCVVVDRINSANKKYLCAYFTASKKINTSKLKKYLVNLLPNYMIPSYLMQLDSFPLTLNHKIDKKNLPDPTLTLNKVGKYVGPTTETQKVLCAIISSALNAKKISIDSDLFDYNIDSLDIIEIQTKLLEYNIKINTQEFYKYRTIKELSKFIDSETDKDSLENESYLKNINNSFINHDTPVNIKHFSYSNILITGATGYLGIHVLHEILENTLSNITCLIRQKSSLTTAKERVLNLYKFYFNTVPNLDRINLICCDVTKPQFNLSKNQYDHIFNGIDLIINTAANVRYYGDYLEFKEINIDLVNNLINLSLEKNIKLVHISTLGLAGNYLISNNKLANTFSENDFYIGQNFNENVYLKTKAEAEMLIYEKAKENLDACIIRVGNLTGRYSDGQFQKNINENAFYNILRVVLKYKIVPKALTKELLEFTPVDICADAIVKLLYNYDVSKRVFHVFNNNYIKASHMMKILTKLGYKTDSLDGIDFKNNILKFAKSEHKDNIIKSIINLLDDKNGISFSPSIIELNEISNSYLAELGFNWPKVDTAYIKKIVDYMKNNNYI